ncbi:hypothetical protein [Myxacorys almedinensis]|uniref:Uncharacterized protein n=1 Tax=Myxacorys almedinensis A TaxID=2690445 RepID=A0A8J7Z0R7_9CYAN|nr:hypothetical protein [Myxacorys almedinensis]NDJ17977.1 hypothetical protein [Myxacorys almedinensis A]
MSWKLYEIDRIAQELIIKFRDREVLGESHKMRATTAYGLERFWGEHLRLEQKERDKAAFWKATWDALCQIMKQAGITIPNDKVSPQNTGSIKAMSEKLWAFDIEERKIALAILIELCDSLVWWTQRYKKPKN